MTRFEVRTTGTRALRFDDGAPVRAASAITGFGNGWLVVQDDATHAAWWREERIEPVRLLPPVEGHDTFREAHGTKRLKPDLESACTVPTGGGEASLVLGSGSSPARTRGALVRLSDTGPDVRVADLAPLFERIAAALDIPLSSVNLEGACVVDGALRWFQRGLAANDVPSASVDLELAALIAIFDEEADPREVPVRGATSYRFDEVGGVALAVTDAVALPDGRVIVSATAEETDDPVADGPVHGSALALLDGGDVHAVAPLPSEGDTPWKVEGLAIERVADGQVGLVAVTDEDDPDRASTAFRIEVDLRP